MYKLMYMLCFEIISYQIYCSRVYKVLMSLETGEDRLASLVALGDIKAIKSQTSEFLKVYYSN